jgi:tripartite-type tricarboxylate transporter receptor subunit TctC
MKRSLSGPKGLPKEIVQRLNQETFRILELPDVKKRVVQDAFDPKPLTPDELAAFLETETARWTPIAQAATKKQ